MPRLVCILVSAAMILGCQTGAATAADPDEGQDETEFSMQDYEWSHRPLIVFAKEDTKAGALERRVERAWNQFVERDMVLIWIDGDRVEVREGSTTKTLGSIEARELRAKFDAAEHRVFLVGKDGGVKLRAGFDVELSQIFELIDSMPMRQREMRERED